MNREKIFTVRDRLASIDWVGSVICIGMVVSLLLPLQWGGITKSWDDATVIVLFCLSALLLGIFVLWEWRKGDGALVPFTMFRRRSQFGAASATVRPDLSVNGTGLFVCQFFIGLGLFIGVVRLSDSRALRLTIRTFQVLSPSLVCASYLSYFSV
jgi:hypothetical protein